MNAVILSSIAERNEFIGRVYILLLASIVASAAGAAFGVSIALDFSHYWPLAGIELLMLVTAIGLRKVPGWNLVALFSFTSVSGFTTSPLLNFFIRTGRGWAVLAAFGLTVLIFSLLTIYVFWSKKDFSFLGGFLFTCLCLFLIAIIIALFFPALWHTYLFCGFGVLLFSGYVLYDTSQILYHCNTDEYVLATINLYLDFLNLFVDLLRIIAESIDFGGFIDIS